MNEAQKARLAALKEKGADSLSEQEKVEYDLLLTIEKQDGQIAEKDTLIGKKATEIDDLKKQIGSASGSEKEALEAKLAEKEESLATLRAGLSALKDAKDLNQQTAGKILPVKPGHGDTVDPKEVDELKRKAMASEESKAAVEAAYANMTDADKALWKSDPKFQKQILQTALGSGGDETDDSPWDGLEKDEGAPAETEEERIQRLFGKQQQQHRKMPPGSSGRAGSIRQSLKGAPKAKERPLDTRSN